MTREAGGSDSSGAKGIRTISVLVSESQSYRGRPFRVLSKADGKEGEVLYMGIIDILQEHSVVFSSQSREFHGFTPFFIVEW